MVIYMSLRQVGGTTLSVCLLEWMSFNYASEYLLGRCSSTHAGTLATLRYDWHMLCLTYSTMSDMQYVRHAVCQICSISDMQYVRHSHVCHRHYVRHPYVWRLPCWNALCLTDWAFSASIDTTYSAHLSAMVEYFACETFLSKQQCRNFSAWNLTICILFYLNDKENTWTALQLDQCTFCPRPSWICSLLFG